MDPHPTLDDERRPLPVRERLFAARYADAESEWSAEFVGSGVAAWSGSEDDGVLSNPYAVAATNIIRLVVAVITRAAFGWSGK